MTKEATRVKFLGERLTDEELRVRIELGRQHKARVRGITDIPALDRAMRDADRDHKGDQP